MKSSQFNFPKNFLWGAATSAHQVEGNNFQSDWWDWESQGLVKEKSGVACDHWNRFREDFQLAKTLSHNAHRFSIEWSRIEPEEGCFDTGAISHYREVIDSLRENGLEPVLTLQHFTLPAWLARKGSWDFENSPELFARYTEKVVRTLGENVRYWITINEPMVYMAKGYLTGEWPPGKKMFYQGLQAIANMLKAHVLAYEVLKKNVSQQAARDMMVGIAHYVVPCFPHSPFSIFDHISAGVRSYLANDLVVQSLMRGFFDFSGAVKMKFSRKKTLDFIGINYYTRHFVRNAGLQAPGILGTICDPSHHGGKEQNDLGWEIYPEGLCRAIRMMKKYHLPVMITENGICTRNDELRSSFILNHVRAVARAMKEGANVLGYLYWSLMDNFEWADGFSPRFGLVEVDYSTQNRRIRKSSLVYSDVCKSGCINF